MDEQVLEILQKVVLVILELTVPALAAWIISELKRWREQREDDSWSYALERIVRDAVTAAEQLGLTDQLAEFAESKLDYAIQYVEQALAFHGYAIDLDQYVEVIRAMIEAEVRRQFPNEGTLPLTRALTG